MRRRVLAAAAVVGWSKAAVATPVALAMALEQPAAASTAPSMSPAATATSCDYAPFMYAPVLLAGSQPSTVSTTASSFNYKGAHPVCPGTLSLRASSDRAQWKTLGSATFSDNGSTDVRANCLPGTWWYKGLYVSDDGGVVAETDTSNPTQFTC